MQSSDFGENLNFIIICDYVYHHNWMSFLTWYSLYKNLPDSKVSMICKRTPMKYDLFGWTKRCNIPFKIVKDSQQVVLPHDLNAAIVLTPDYVCIRDFSEAGISPKSILGKDFFYIDDSLGVDCKSEKSSLFVSYFHGWGNFDLTRWINKETCPLNNNLKFSKVGMTANEVRLGQVWKEASKIFQTVSRG